MRIHTLDTDITDVSRIRKQVRLRVWWMDLYSSTFTESVPSNLFQGGQEQVNWYGVYGFVVARTFPVCIGLIINQSPFILLHVASPPLAASNRPYGPDRRPGRRRLGL